MFLLPFMTLEYPLILEIHLKLFQKHYNSFIGKTFSKIYKKGKALETEAGEEGWGLSNDLLPHHKTMKIHKVLTG